MYACISMAEKLGQFEDLHPGRYTLFPWRVSVQPPISLSVAVLDSPPHFLALTPFAAIFVPRFRLIDWIFSTENGHWDLLFSASVSRLVVLSRVPEAEVTYAENQDGHRGQPSLSTRHTAQRRSSTGSAGAAADASKEYEEDEEIKRHVASLLGSLFPRRCFPDGPPADLFVSYEDNVECRVVVETSYSPMVGDILVEDVELVVNRDDEGYGRTNIRTTELRRRMRFQRVPNLIQTEIPIGIFKNGQPAFNIGLTAIQGGEELEMRPDHTELVHAYLPPIVAGFVLASPRLEACVTAGNKVRALSIGIGGGALPVFLHRKLGFHVFAVDIDKTVLGLARRHFGLEENEHLRIVVNDGLDAVRSVAQHSIKRNFVSIELQKEWQKLGEDVQGSWCESSILDEHPEGSDVRMDVIVVDVDAGDSRLGLVSPPPAFLLKTFLLAARIALHDGGMLTMNIIPRGAKNYKIAVNALREVFEGLYEIQVEDNHVVFAFPGKLAEINLNCTFALQIMKAIDERMIYRITEVDI